MAAPEEVAYPRVMLVAYCHSAKTGWNTVDDLDRLSDLRVEAGNLLWAEADVKDLGDEEMSMLAEEFNLHRLAVEDATHTNQRPKIDPYDDHLFVVLHELAEHDGQLEASQIACFIGERFVLTIHEGPQRVLDEAKERWEKAQKELGQGPAYLFYTILDAIVDDYERITTQLEDQIEGVEELALAQPNAPIQKRLYSLKQRVARLRRYVFPVTRIIEWIDHPDHDTRLLADARPLFRDVHDHLNRITDQVRNIDELSQAVIDLQRSEQANLIGQVNKKLTAWAAIIAVPTFIASVYGMNFDLTPADGKSFGFWFALTLMAICAVSLYVYFGRKKWL